MRLGVCYYPEHWAEDRWATDAAEMARLGLSRVRVGEFAWSRLEPARDDFRFDWLRRAVDTLGEAGLGVILCTPTATPPKWLVDARPDILPTGADGRVRGFGSRRHYSHSSRAYREESQRITRALVGAFGHHPAIVGWQTDNEYGCHDTVEDYGPEAARAFRLWLEDRYGTVDALNAAWGNVFWSMEYASFAEIDPPMGAVTELNPAHRLDFQRFSSDQVVAFDAEQVAIIRAGSPGRFVCHNTMGVSRDYDHFDLGAQHDMLAWDSYPLGFLEQSAESDAFKNRFFRQGDPDFQAFHHDLYRNCAPEWGVMEQQNGPVNWAPYNPFPDPGMVRLWTLEAWAHGASLVSYFRWRQAPFGQEQNHSGLLDVDGHTSTGGREVEGLAAEIAGLGERGAPVREVALVFDYAADWMIRIQPQGADFDYWRLVLTFYRACRSLGHNVDVVSPRADLSPYRLVVAPTLPAIDTDALKATDAVVFLGPRSGSKTPAFQISTAQSPDHLSELLPMRVPRWESLRPGAQLPLNGDLKGFSASIWRDHLDVRHGTRVRASADGLPAWVAYERMNYLGVWPDEGMATEIVKRLAGEAGLTTTHLPRNVRARTLEDRVVLFNYGDKTAEVMGLTLPPAGVVIRD